MTTNYLSKQDVAYMIRNWLEGNITSNKLAVWADDCSEKWEEGELRLEDADFLYEVLCELKLADEKEVASNKPTQLFCSEDAQRLLRWLDDSTKPLSLTNSSSDFMYIRLM